MLGIQGKCGYLFGEIFAVVVDQTRAAPGLPKRQLMQLAAREVPLLCRSLAEMSESRVALGVVAA